MNFLEEIIAYKKIEIEECKERLPQDKLQQLIKEKELIKRDFYKSLKNKVDKKEIALIAEIKKASPSKGIIRADFNHIEIAKAYKKGGACCLSVLTDKKYFQGNIQYIKEIKEIVDLPVLRKDFIVDPYQIYESIYAGADCILLIASALEKDLLKRLFETAIEKDLNCLIEVHDEREMEMALELLHGTFLIGINNRDLKTFQTDLNITKNLVKKYRRDLLGKIIISESGIFTNDDIKTLMQSGVYAFLIGEALIKEKDIEGATKKLITY